MADTTFGRKEHTIPVVENAAVRDALFPSPLPHQRVVRLDTGMIDRYDPTLAWLPEGVTRASGPIVGSKAKGCKADGSANDGPVLDAAGAFGLAIATTGTGELDVGTHYVSTNATIPGHVRPHRGSWLKPANGVTVTFSGTVEEVNYAWIDESLGGRVLFTGSAMARIPAIWFKTYSRILPGPTAAPAVGYEQFTGFGVTPAHQVQVCYSLVGWTGETALSPVTTIVMGSQNSGLLVVPRVLAGSLAVGYKVYTKDITAGEGSFSLQVPNPGGSAQQVITFGDIDLDAFAPAVNVQNGNGTYAGTGALDAAGNAIAAPSSAPDVFFSDNPSQTYYQAYSYLDDNGNESPLSPISSGVAVPTQAAFRQRPLEQPPAGAVFRRLYAGTVATAASMHKQIDVPLGFCVSHIYNYNAAGAAPPNAGAGSGAANNYASEDQAWDAIHDSGGARVVLKRPGVLNRTAPFIARYDTAVALNGNPVRMGMISHAPHGWNVNGGLDTMQWGGTSTGVEMFVSFASQAEFIGLDMPDPNGKVKYGIHLADFSGNQSFTTFFRQCGVEAMATDGIGFQIHARSATGVNQHTASEIHGIGCSITGAGWGIRLSGVQTQNITFSYGRIGNNGGKSAGGTGHFGDGNTWVGSGDVNVMDGRLGLDKVNVSGNGDCLYHVSALGVFPGGNSAAQLSNYKCYGDGLSVATKYWSMGAQDTSGGVSGTAGGQIYDHGANYTEGGSRAVYAAVVFNNGAIVVDHPERVNGRVYFNTGAARLSCYGKPIDAATNAAWFKHNNADAVHNPSVFLFGGAVSFHSDTAIGKVAKFEQPLPVKAWTPGLIANGAQASIADATVAGSQVGDKVEPTASIGLLGGRLWGEVTVAGTVTYYLANSTGAGITLGALTLNGVLKKRA